MTKMNWHDKLIKWFVDDYPSVENDTDRVDCSLDDVKVECLSFELMDRGFHFDVEKDWWERTWLVATKTGAETSKEVYQKKGTYWKTMMFSSDGQLYYESTIGDNTNGTSDNGEGIQDNSDTTMEE